VKCIQCRIRVYSGRWGKGTHGFRPSWGNRLYAAVQEAVAGKGELWGLAFTLTEPNSVGLAVTIGIWVGWRPGDPNLLVGRLHEQMVARLRPESERQIEVEVMDSRDIKEDSLLAI
jgi:hypothetical protein